MLHTAADFFIGLHEAAPDGALLCFQRDPTKGYAPIVFPAEGHIGITRSREPGNHL
jgi:hypothetical protein